MKITDIALVGETTQLAHFSLHVTPDVAMHGLRLQRSQNTGELWIAGGKWRGKRSATLSFPLQAVVAEAVYEALLQGHDSTYCELPN